MIKAGRNAVIGATALAAVCVAGGAGANYIDYGDVDIDNATFTGAEGNGIQESSSAGSNFDISPPPLYGAPIPSSSGISFSTGPFGAGAMDDDIDGASGQLDFVLEADPGYWIEYISFREVGDYVIMGNNSEVSISGLLYIEYDAGDAGWQPLEDLISYDPHFQFSFTEQGSDMWKFEQDFDFAGLDEQIDRLKVNFNNTIITEAGSVEAAFADKKSLTINTVSVPEPGSAVLLAAGGALLLMRRRKAAAC